MKARCLIVDDEPLAIQLLEAHVSRVPMLEIVGTCTNAMDAFEMLKKHQIDLLFLDIQMPMLTGVEFLKSLQNPPKVVFTTAYREYAMEGYELDVLDYLLKPITFERFFKSINKYFDLGKSVDTTVQTSGQVGGENDYVFVNVNKKQIKVSFQDILYVESLKDYVRIHLVDQALITKDKISAFDSKLPDGFMRVHRSYLVNKAKITAYTATDIEIGRVEIPIGVSYKREVIESLK